MVTWFCYLKLIQMRTCLTNVSMNAGFKPTYHDVLIIL
jgi:hypothetical protein